MPEKKARISETCPKCGYTSLYVRGDMCPECTRRAGIEQTERAKIIGLERQAALNAKYRAEAAHDWGRPHDSTVCDYCAVEKLVNKESHG